MSFEKAKSVVSQEHLSTFLEVSEKLNDVYLIERKQLSDDWISFNTNLGKSIIEFYKFGNSLYKDLNLSYEDIRFYSFYLDFIVSRPSNSIFTETPKETELDLYTRSSKKIALLAQHLYNLDNAHNDTFNIHFHELYTNVFAYFDFLFYKDSGGFSKFSTNKKLFMLQNEFMQQLVSNADINKLKIILQNLHIDNIHISTIFHDKNDLEELTVDSFKEPYSTKEVFEKYIANQKEMNNDPIVFEIFSYVLSNKLWKIIKIVQRQPEFIDSADLEKEEKDFITKIKEYIVLYLEATSRFYDVEISLHEYYLEIHSVDYDFINNYLFKKVLTSIEKDSPELLAPLSHRKAELWKDKRTVSSKELINILKPIINNSLPEKFKLYRLIRDGSFEDIALVIDVLHQKIVDTNALSDNVEYIGILRSGSFLAHALNILKSHLNDALTNTRVVSVLMHPYLTIMPRLLSLRNGDIPKRFIYIDEAIKSGYGLSVADEYRKKILHSKNIKKSDSDIAISIANMTEYNKHDLLKNDSLVNVARTKDKKGLCFQEKIDVVYDLTKQFDWKLFIDILPKIKCADVKRIAKIGNQYDTTIIISDSILLFQVAIFMAEQIKEKTDQIENLLFYSGSTEGNLLIDTLVFVYKIKYENSKKFYINAKKITEDEIDNIKEFRTIFVDMSIDGGSTRENVYNLDVPHKLRRKSIQKFDLSLFIFGRFENFTGEENIYISHFEE